MPSSPEQRAHDQNFRFLDKKIPKPKKTGKGFEVVHEEEPTPLVSIDDDLDGSDKDDPSPPQIKPKKVFNARQPDKKSNFDQRFKEQKRQGRVVASPKDESVTEVHRDYPEMGENRFLIDMSMEQVAHNGLEDLNLETLIDWMKETGRVSYVESKRLGMKHRFENLKALFDVPLQTREHQKEISEQTVGDAVNTCLKTFYDFHERNKDVLQKLGLDFKDTSASDQLAKFLSLWIGWYGNIYNTGLNHEMTKQKAHERSGVMSNFTDGLSKCLENFDLHIENMADRALDRESAFTLRQEIRKVYKTFGNMIDHIPYETPEVEIKYEAYKKAA